MIAMCNKINRLLHVNASTPWLHQHCSPAFLQLAQRFEIKASSTCPKCLFSHLQISPCCLAETAWLHLKTCRTTDPKIWKFKWGETTTTWFCEEFLCSFVENLLLQSSHLKLIEIPTCLSQSGQYIFHFDLQHLALTRNWRWNTNGRTLEDGMEKETYQCRCTIWTKRRILIDSGQYDPALETQLAKHCG